MAEVIAAQAGPVGPCLHPLAVVPYPASGEQENQDQQRGKDTGHAHAHRPGNELIVDLPEWPHPIPRVGDYIFHPPPRPSPEGIAGCVKTVTWRTHDRGT